MEAAGLDPGVGEPPAHGRHARRVAVIEVRPRREQLDEIEPVAADDGEMPLVEAFRVKQVRGQPESRHFSSSTWRARIVRNPENRE